MRRHGNPRVIITFAEDQMVEPTRRQELTSAVQAVLESKRDEASQAREDRIATERRAQRQPALAVLLVIGWGVLGWLWISQPAAIFGEKPLAARSPALAEASMRYALYLQRTRVENYRRSHGRLPTSLATTGQVEGGVTYGLIGGGYVLEGFANGSLLRLTSSMAPDSFLGSSVNLLRRQK